MISPLVSFPSAEATSSNRERVFPSAAEESLRELLKRCSPRTVEAACAFRRTGRPEQVPLIVYGIIERYADRDRRARLRTCDHSLRLVEDLGMDSLGMLEAVTLLEEVVPISLKDEDLRGLRTIADVERACCKRLP